MPFKNINKRREYQRAYKKRSRRLYRGERSSLDNLKGDPTNLEPIHSDIAELEHDFYSPKRTFWQKLFGSDN